MYGLRIHSHNFSIGSKKRMKLKTRNFQLLSQDLRDFTDLL